MNIPLLASFLIVCVSYSFALKGDDCEGMLYHNNLYTLMITRTPFIKKETFCRIPKTTLSLNKQFCHCSVHQRTHTFFGNTK